MFKTKIKKAHLFALQGAKNRLYMPTTKRRQKGIWKQMFLLLF